MRRSKALFYVSTYNANDKSQWSGLGYYIMKSLIDQGFDVSQVFPLQYKPGIINKLKSRIFPNYICPRDLTTIKNYSKQVDQIINGRSGIIFSPGSIPVAYLKSHNPVVIYTDATVASMINYYDSFADWTPRSIKIAIEIEKSALERADLLLFASDWAANSAINDYGISSSKVKVIPFGANIINAPSINFIKNLISEKLNKPMELLFIGVDWERKGGSLILELFYYLINNGIKVHLHIVGPKFNPLNTPIDGVYFYGYLDKNKEDDLNLLTSLFLKSHFFIMLSKAECYGLVYCEANAYGIPVVGFNTGGVATIINEQNGILLEMESKVEEIANKLLHIYQSNDQYFDLSVSSYNMFLDRFNWDIAGSSIKKCIEDI